MRSGAAGAVLLLALAGVTAAQEDPSAFPPGPNRDEAFYLCTACHSARLVTNQALSRERWDRTLSWMTERHGMPALEGEERERILDYLTAALGPERAGRQERSPFLTRPDRRNPFSP